MDNTRQRPSKPSLWNDPKVRAIIFQALMILAIIGVGYYLVSNVLEQYAAKGITAGFDFLNNGASFEIAFAVIPFSAGMSYGKLFIVGLLNTMLISVIGIFFATIIGFVVGVARLSSNWIVSKLALVYIEIFRNIPLLLQILFWNAILLASLPPVRDAWAIGESFFFSIKGASLPAPVFLPGAWLILVAIVVAFVAAFLYRRWARKKQDKTGKQQPVAWTMLGIIIGLPVLTYFLTGRPVDFDVPVLGRFNFAGGMHVIPEILSLAVLALSVYTASFIAEIVRSGINAVSSGQKEAADALGLPANRKLSLVVIPQAMRVIIPQLTSQYLNLTKNSSLAMAIGFSDLVAVFMGTTLNQVGRSVEIVAMTMSVYLFLSLTISMFMNWYNKKMMLVER